ncbi:hypothetical protein FGG79_03195 [Bacillus sp. BHET2]|uniref:hypothetical protein n=1 Tax=Bacillus sp. BHET2 TaxID=2583818 RepID=UPI0014876074|nr:hypothetical protein [Bacillus sp. BHET2]TMU87156.1 hypothetical protein FGG79_03195 [Bacillus sp. BHET2]
MKKMCMNVAILSLALLIGGCANGPESTTDAGTSEENSQVASDMNETTSSVDSKDSVQEDSSENEGDSAITSGVNESEISSDEDNASEDNMNTDEDIEQNTETVSSPDSDLKVEDKATTKEKAKAESLVKEYLKEKDELIEDDNHFVNYDGTIKDYVIIWYSSLVSGHSSTNGRYIVDLKKGEVTEFHSPEDMRGIVG